MIECINGFEVWIKSFKIIYQITGDGLFQSVVALLTVLLISFGWWLTSKLQKKLIDNNLRIEVYKEISRHIENVNNKAQILSVRLRDYDMTFILMESPLSPKKPWEPGSANSIWSKFISDINGAWFDFADTHNKCATAISKWQFLLSEIKEMHNKIFYEYFLDLFKKHNECSSFLRDLPLKNNDWQEWDRKEIKKKVDEFNDELTKIVFQYFDDYTVEVHNELIGGVFGYKKKFRQDHRNLGNEYDIFTRKGIKKVKKTKFFQK